MIAFTIPGHPVAFARSGGTVVRFTPKKQRDFMALVKLFSAQAMAGRALLDGPLAATIHATYVPPKSWSRKAVAEALWKTSKPDADNLGKLVMDSINKIVYDDDATVADLHVTKTYGAREEVRVEIRRLT